MDTFEDLIFKAEDNFLETEPLAGEIIRSNATGWEIYSIDIMDSQTEANTTYVRFRFTVKGEQKEDRPPTVSEIQGMAFAEIRAGEVKFNIRTAEELED